MQAFSIHAFIYVWLACKLVLIFKTQRIISWNSHRVDKPPKNQRGREYVDLPKLQRQVNPILTKVFVLSKCM